MAENAKFLQKNPKTAFEEKDWPIGYVGWVFLGTLVFLAIVPFILMAAFPRALPDTNRQMSVEPSAPRLQINPSADLVRYETEQDKRLRSYYWIDKKKGIVHIPIEAAMQKIARTGIPGFPKASR